MEGIFIYYKYIRIALADCPPETGGRGAKRRRGWIKPITTHYYLITFPPPPHCVVLTPVPGGESGCSVIAGTLWLQFHTALADCPPETGGTRSEVTEGVDKTNHHSLLSNYLSTPSPLRGTHPCLRGRKWMLGHCRNTVVTISPRQQTVPLRQGDEERSDGGGG